MPEHHPQIERQAAFDVGRQGQLVDGHFARSLIGDRHDVDADAAVDGQLSLGQHVAQVFVAVADDDDSLGAIGRKCGLRQLHAIGQVRVFGVEQAFDLRGKCWIGFQRRRFDQRFAAKDDYAGAIVAPCDAA